MSKSDLGEAALLLLLLLLIVFLVAAAVIGSNEVSQKGVEVPLGRCYAPLGGDGPTFCNVTWLKNLSYVTVSRDGHGGDMLVLFTFQTVESHGYSITSGGLSIYIEPAR